MIITIGFVPKQNAIEIVNHVGGVIVREDRETHLCDVQFKGYIHTIKIYDVGNLRIENTTTHKSTLLYWNEYESLIVQNDPYNNEKC